MPSSSLSGHRGLLLLVVAASLSTLATSEINPFTWADCLSTSPPESSSANSSTFQSNVAALLDELPSAAAQTGFAALSRGTGVDRAFVRGICRGDASPDDCATFLRTAAAGIVRNCNDTISGRAAVWYDKCFLSYGDTDVSTDHENTIRPVLYNSGLVSDKVAFEQTYHALMGRLAARVVNGSATASASSPAPMFATGEAVYDSNAPNGTMYGLLQCMRDRTPAECDNCLQASMRRLPGCCYGNQGGVVLGYNCYLRVEIYPYYHLTLDVPAPVPAPLAPAPSSVIGDRNGKKRPDITLAIAVSVGILLGAVIVVSGVLLYRRRVNRHKKLAGNDMNEEGNGNIEPGQLNLTVLRAATNNFSEANKLGEGGFGEVFKGTLPNGEEIAVKRLSRHSSQGFSELKTELVLATKLKHRNLVQLLGVCLREEKLLIYEYLPNRSLDTFLFDTVRRQQLNWSKRFDIMCGIARGLLYLHEESRLKVIHRDLKPSNVLLDAEMNPKISDFGLARAFGGDQSRDITRRPVGTLGYMSPEYAYYGHVSTKSDMFSFGVIILEMVTGRRNNSTYECADSVSLLSYVWGKWTTGSTIEVADPLLDGHYPEDELLNCVEIGLLCVQENPADRPDASAVALMLSSYSTTDERHPPSRPAFVFGSGHSGTPYGLPAGAWSREGALIREEQPLTASISENEVTISELQPR